MCQHNQRLFSLFFFLNRLSRTQVNLFLFQSYLLIVISLTQLQCSHKLWSRTLRTMRSDTVISNSDKSNERDAQHVSGLRGYMCQVIFTNYLRRVNSLLAHSFLMLAECVNELALDVTLIWVSWRCRELVCESGFSLVSEISIELECKPRGDKQRPWQHARTRILVFALFQTAFV